MKLINCQNFSVNQFIIYFYDRFPQKNWKMMLPEHLFIWAVIAFSLYKLVITRHRVTLFFIVYQIMDLYFIHLLFLNLFLHDEYFLFCF